MVGFCAEDSAGASPHRELGRGHHHDRHRQVRGRTAREGQTLMVLTTKKRQGGYFLELCEESDPHALSEAIGPAAEICELWYAGWVLL